MLGGLAIFIFGLQMLSRGLQDAAGKKVNRAIEMLTSIPVVGVLVGAAVTVIVNSSTLTTVMTVSFVNAAILNLKQAAAVIMGANIGTTLTGHLVAFRITDFWVYFAFVGFLLYFIAKGKTPKLIGQIMLAFGMLLLGLALMSDAMRPLRTHEGFQALIVTFSNNRFLAVLVGILFTAIVQSSSAVTSIIILMTIPDPYTQESLIGINAAIALIVGANIGTCVTAVLASIGSTVAAKRTAAIHVVINVFGALVFLIFSSQFIWAVLAISPDGVVERQAANAHSIFSLIIVAVFLPLITPLVRFVTFILPERKTQAASPLKHNRFPDHALGNPFGALKLARNETRKLVDVASINLVICEKWIVSRKKKHLRQLKFNIKVSDASILDIEAFLAKLLPKGLSPSAAEEHTHLISALGALRRTNELLRSTARKSTAAIENEIELSPEMEKGISRLAAQIVPLLNAVAGTESDPVLKERKPQWLHHRIDIRMRKLREEHSRRIRDGASSVDSEMAYTDILESLVNIGDYAFAMVPIISTSTKPQN